MNQDDELFLSAMKRALLDFRVQQAFIPVVGHLFEPDEDKTRYDPDEELEDLTDLSTLPNFYEVPVRVASCFFSSVGLLNLTAQFGIDALALGSATEPAASRPGLSLRLRIGVNNSLQILELLFRVGGAVGVNIPQPQPPLATQFFDFSCVLFRLGASSRGVGSCQHPSVKFKPHGFQPVEIGLDRRRGLKVFQVIEQFCTDFLRNPLRLVGLG